MPSIHTNKEVWEHISNLKLGGDKFNIRAPVDIILGAHAYSQIIELGIIHGYPGQPMAMETIFGWILLGNTQITRVWINFNFLLFLGSIFLAVQNIFQSIARNSVGLF